ncbi:MAG: hypothetical protein CMA64_06540 [Euryarchaeota archaeon]|nr:hypothetical protein [Euryarchaeota archaeon]
MYIMEMLDFNDIMAGDSVTIKTPQGQEVRGKAVMKGPHGWVINTGGRHGTPRVVSESNFVKMRKGKNRKADYFGNFMYGG